MTYIRMAFTCLALSLPLQTASQAFAQDAETGGAIAVQPAAGLDQRIEDRLRSVFAQIEALEEVTVATEQGVVALGGAAANDSAAKRAAELAQRIEGVVAVEDRHRTHFKR